MASEKITALIEEVKGLTVLELSELVHALEDEFGVSAAAMAAPAAGAGAAAPAAEEKTEFDVVLASFDAAAKIKVIKAVREITGLGLAEAKGMVEGAPKTLKEAVSKDEAELLTYVLNQTLTGLPLSSITAERFDIVRRAAGLTALLAPVAEYIAELIAELSDQKVYLDGASKLLRFPEYRDTKKAQTLLDYMEDDRKHLLPATRKIDGIQFFIGPENGENPLSETSAIYAKYDIGKIGQGAIGIVGPTRMDYAKLSAQLSRFAKGLNKLIAETFLDEKDGNH